MVPRGSQELRWRKKGKGGSLFRMPEEAPCGWGWAARPAGSTCLTCSAHWPLRRGTAASSWAGCQQLPGHPPAVCTHLSLAPSPAAPVPREAGMRMLTQKLVENRTKGKGEGGRGRKIPGLHTGACLPIQLVMGVRLGGAWSCAWPLSGPNRRAALSL